MGGGKVEMKRGGLCNVLNCNHGDCVHSWSGVKCHCCDYEMILNRKNGLLFCSCPIRDWCDFSIHKSALTKRLNRRYIIVGDVS